VHGDPEPDNLVVDDRTAIFVDLDDAEPGDPVDDLAFALRAWTPPGGLPDLSELLPAAFLAGYQETGLVDLARLPAAVREVERRTLASYLAHASTPADPDWPDWALRLHAVVSERATELGAVL
jgi:Ser/Thr protein kinase RdoA (MazF antagonist)